MFEEESIWIKNELMRINSKKVNTILNIGSSTLYFRTKIQPFIDENIFKPLRLQKKRVYHLDIKKEKGVDIVCDINNLNRIDKKFDVVICTSLLEHIWDLKKIAINLKLLVNKGGYLLVTVPHRYFYHADPIDTMYRPDNKQLEKLFSGSKVITSKIIKINKLLLRKRLFYFRNMLKNILSLHFIAIPKILPYLFKKFEVSCLLVQIR